MDEIRKLIHRYADAVCRFDPEQWTATWAPDGVWTMLRGSIQGREEIGAKWTEIMKTFPAVVHVYYNGTCELDEASNTGTGRWYVGEFFTRPDGETNTLYGYYDDEYVRVDGEWLFANRTLEALYRGKSDMTGTYLLASDD